MLPRSNPAYLGGAGERRAVRSVPSVLFLILMALGLASACSGTPHTSFLPTGTQRFSPGLRIMLRKHHKRGKGITKADFYYPPSTVTGPGGSYCALTHFPTGPNDWPAYNCFFKNYDTLTFTNMWQVPDNHPPIGYCGETTWASVVLSHSGSYIVTVTATPDPSGLGDWNCARLDTADSITYMNGNSSNNWALLVNVAGSFEECNLPSCSPHNNEEVGAEITFQQFQTPLPTPIPTPTGGGSGWPSPPPSVGLVIYDNRLGQVVSTGVSPFPSSVIGLRNDLTAKQTDGGTPQYVNWEQVGLPAIASQSPITAPSVSEAPLDLPTPANPIKFYWVGGGSQSIVEVTGTVNGQLMTAFALYRVEAPTFGNMTATFATPRIHASALELGTASPSPDAGIISNYAATAPQDFAGYYAETQLLHSNPSTSPATSPPIFTQTGSEYWVDGCWLQNVQGDTLESPAPEFSPGAAVTYGPTFDAPAYPLGIDGMTQLSVDDSFVDYFMFAPAVQSWQHYVWVNFGKLVWSWGGVATQLYLNGTPAGWALSSRIVPGPTQTGVPNSDPVGWPNIAETIGSSCPSPPPGDHSAARKAWRQRHFTRLSKPVPRATR